MTSYPCILVILIIHLTICGLPTALAAGGGCWAAPMFYGPTCSSDTSIFGSPGHTIQYSIDVIGDTQLCCNALSCSHSCSLVNIGCGHGSWSSGSLPWGNNLATPQIKCKGVPLGSSYTFSH